MSKKAWILIVATGVIAFKLSFLLTNPNLDLSEIIWLIIDDSMFMAVFTWLAYTEIEKKEEVQQEPDDVEEVDRNITINFYDVHNVETEETPDEDEQELDQEE